MCFSNWSEPAAIAAVLLATVSVFIGALGVFQMSKVGNELEKEIINSGRETRHSIADSTASTLDAIRQNGEETRSAIREVHKSIKRELE